MHRGDLGSRWMRTAGISALFTVGFLMLMGRGELSDDQINYVAIADRILDPAGPPVLWVPYRTFSFLIAALSSFTHDHIVSIKSIFAGTAFLYFVAMSRYLGIFFKKEPVIWAVTLLSMTPAYTLGMTFWGFGGFEFILARILFMPLVPCILYLFWDPASPRRRAWSLLICAAGTALSFEALLLLAILILGLVIEAVLDARVRAGLRGVLGWGIAGSAALTAVIFLSPLLYDHQDMFFNLTPGYLNSITANHQALQAMSHADFIDLFWKASYACCWWTMFPPRLTDILFVLANQALLITAAVVGWRTLRVAHAVAARRMVLWVATALAVAYGYLLLRYAGWKIFLLPPHTFEEVRAVKFIQPVLFVCAGMLLDRMWTARARTAFVLTAAALCVAPLSAVRNIPSDLKQRAYDTVSRYVHDPEKLVYVAKVFALEDTELKNDFDLISESIRERVKDDEFVLSTYYPLRLTGKKVIMLYNDKRNGNQFFNGKFYPKLPYWHVAYQEISKALDSCDASAIIGLAQKYQTSYVAAPCSLTGPEWETLVRGRRLSLYRRL